MTRLFRNVSKMVKMNNNFIWVFFFLFIDHLLSHYIILLLK